FRALRRRDRYGALRRDNRAARRDLDLRRSRHDRRGRPGRGRPRLPSDGADGRSHTRPGPEHRRGRPAARERHRPERRRHLRARPGASAQLRSPASRGRYRAGGGIVRVGIFGIGLAAYWLQFEGLRGRLEAYQRGIEAHLDAFGAEVISAGLVDTAQAAREAGERLAAARPDLLLLYTATYATSSQVLPTVQAVDAPVVILNLQPTRTFDYEAMTTAEW